MRVTLLGTNGLTWIDAALGQCYAKGCYTDPSVRDRRIRQVALRQRHESVLEFGIFLFEIEASTKVLLEMTRHRMASYAVKSSRYTLNKGEIVFEDTGHPKVDLELTLYKQTIEDLIADGIGNDLVSLMLPQAYQYRWQAQFNARSLRNFLHLRRARSAHFHIREVAEAMYQAIPEEMRYLFDEEAA